MPGRLKARVQVLLQILPKPEAVGAQDDAAAHGRIRNELRLEAGGGVPCGEIGRLWRNLLDDALRERFGHDRPRFAGRTRCTLAAARRNLTPSRVGKSMPKHTRIYTRTGDEGTTGLIGGSRIKKDALRLETYGTVDELSSAIGVARAALSATSARDGARDSTRRVASVDARRPVQSRLRAGYAAGRPARQRSLRRALRRGGARARDRRRRA